MASSHYEDHGEKHILALVKAQREFGVARFKLGLILSSIKENELWRGRAESFSGFLEESKINSSAARQYMLVASKLMEFNLTEREIEELAMVNMSTLEKACAVMDAGNHREILDLILMLSERDAKHELDLIQKPVPKGKQDPKVRKILAEFRHLPHELRIETMTSLGLHHSIASNRAAGSQNSN